MRTVLSLIACLFYLLVTAGDLDCYVGQGLSVLMEVMGRNEASAPDHAHKDCSSACDLLKHKTTVDYKSILSEWRTARISAESFIKLSSAICSLSRVLFVMIIGRLALIRYARQANRCIFMYHYLWFKILRI
ncbi:hypothetical protein ABDD95_07115 [Mucilaginibacter sp. PAMB04274]|uniref:hypothetical protein n=1 Tax=Mucilaginibacter sp. PAMB04274 TaxID=3138568 RepID=UPI0031F71A10